MILFRNTEILEWLGRNEYDSYAVAVYTQDGLQSGYISTFYSKALFSNEKC